MLHTVYIDMDLTIVDIYGALLPGVADRLIEMRERGYELYCWSAGGEEYARALLVKHRIITLFKNVMDKPTMIIDDNPESLLKYPKVIKVNSRDDWTHLPFWESIFGKEIY